MHKLKVYSKRAFFLAIFFASGYLCHGCVGRWLQPDNIFEEIAEDVIKEKLGVDIDLSPHSAEIR